MRWPPAACGAIQLVHYCVNETGDIQTSPPVHHGLTSFGHAAVRRMNALGIMVDVAHCTEATAAGVARVTTRPILCTHANLAWPDQPGGGHPRFISLDYARMVADTGGVVGGWIAVLWEDSMAMLITHILRLVEAIGIDHVGIGTDMPAGVAATEMPDFTRYPEIPAGFVRTVSHPKRSQRSAAATGCGCSRQIRDGRKFRVGLDRKNAFKGPKNAPSSLFCAFLSDG